MEKLFMSAGVVVTIVLCLVGIAKLPFKTFKSTHPKWYKAIFTILSIFLAIGLSIIDEIYIICGSLLSIDFAILLCVVFAGVFAGYGGVYEGLGLKELVKKIIECLRKARSLAKDKNIVKYLNKIDDIDKAIAVLEDRRRNQNNEV